MQRGLQLPGFIRACGLASRPCCTGRQRGVRARQVAGRSSLPAADRRRGRWSGGRRACLAAARGAAGEHRDRGRRARRTALLALPGSDLVGAEDLGPADVEALVDERMDREAPAARARPQPQLARPGTGGCGATGNPAGGQARGVRARRRSLRGVRVAGAASVRPRDPGRARRIERSRQPAAPLRLLQSREGRDPRLSRERPPGPPRPVARRLRPLASVEIRARRLWWRKPAPRNGSRRSPGRSGPRLPTRSGSTSC